MVALWLCVCLQDACWVSRVVGVTCLSQGWPWLSLWLIPWAADRLWEGEAADLWIRKVMGRGGWGSSEEWIWRKSQKGVLLCIHDGVCSSLWSWPVPCHPLPCPYKCTLWYYVLVITEHCHHKEIAWYIGKYADSPLCRELNQVKSILFIHSKICLKFCSAQLLKAVK